MGLTTTVRPVFEPLTITEAKDHLKLEHGVDDGLLAGYILAAREMVEDYTGRRLMQQTLVLTLDEFPSEIRLPVLPVASVTSIEYIDTDEQPQTLAPDKYQFVGDEDEAVIVPRKAVTWPNVWAEREAVTVTFVAGYGDGAADVPNTLRQAIMLMVGFFYEHRGELARVNPEDMPEAARALMNPKKVWRV